MVLLASRRAIPRCFQVGVGCSSGNVGGSAEEEELWASVDGKRAVQARRWRATATRWQRGGAVMSTGGQV